jgi:hypothetical protein
VTAAEEIAKPDVVPNIDRDAERTAHSAATVINSALQHMGLGPDPWKGIVAGVGRLKPFVQAGSRARCAPDLLMHPFRGWQETSKLLSASAGKVSRHTPRSALGHEALTIVRSACWHASQAHAEQLALR